MSIDLWTFVLPLVSGASIVGIGFGKLWGPILGLVAQVVWAYYAATTLQVGVLLASLVYALANALVLFRFLKGNHEEALLPGGSH